jgi:hypothetical protein
VEKRQGEGKGEKRQGRAREKEEKRQGRAREKKD